MDEILEADGIDVLFIGPYDLSSSLGLLGQEDHPRVHEEMKGIIAKVAAKGKAVGTFADNVENMNLWREAGVQYLSYSSDVGMFYAASRAVTQEFVKP